MKFYDQTVYCITKSKLISEVDKKTYYQDNHYMNYLKCFQ